MGIADSSIKNFFNFGWLGSKNHNNAGGAGDPWGEIATVADVLYKVNEASGSIADSRSSETMAPLGSPSYQVSTTNGEANGVNCPSASSSAFRDNGNSLTSWDIPTRQDTVISFEAMRPSGAASGRRVYCANNASVSGFDGWYWGNTTDGNMEAFLLDDSGNSAFLSAGAPDYRDDTRHRFDCILRWSGGTTAMQIWVDDPTQSGSPAHELNINAINDVLISNSIYGPAIGCLANNASHVDGEIYGVSIKHNTLVITDW